MIAVVAGLLAAVPFVAAALALRASLGPPIFFRQTRSGRGQKAFEILKLRTMRDARDATGRLLQDHARQTALSALIRRLRLDELPQLWLILRGEMALVGPRPLLPETVQSLGALGRERASVRPGLTGWAQVSGNTQLSDEEKLRLDLWYIANRSLTLDLRILSETLGVALFGERRRQDRLSAASRFCAEAFGAERVA